MRYPAEQKAETRAKIISVAARLFRERGAETNGIGSVMKEIGLTKGGFYRHFQSRDHLYVAAISEAFRERGDLIVSAVERAPKGRKLKTLIEQYLSMEHLRSRGTGCVMATLGADIPRCSAAVRKQVSGLMLSYRDRFLPYMPGKSREERIGIYSLLFPSMVGVLLVARTLPDQKAQEAMLARARAFFTQIYCSPTGG